jgi:hypothetical protein
MHGYFAADVMQNKKVVKTFNENIKVMENLHA